MKSEVIVIHPKDPTTDFLKEVYRDRYWKVINEPTDKRVLMNEIEQHDRVLLCGHGTPSGLLGYGGFVIDDSFGEILKYKTVSIIWCHSIYYALHHRLQGLCTGMIVSEEGESRIYNLPTDKELIDESNELFATSVRENLFKPNADKLIRKDYVSDTNPIIQFNRKNIFYR